MRVRRRDSPLRRIRDLIDFTEPWAFLVQIINKFSWSGVCKMIQSYKYFLICHHFDSHNRNEHLPKFQKENYIIFHLTTTTTIHTICPDSERIGWWGAPYNLIRLFHYFEHIWCIWLMMRTISGQEKSSVLIILAWNNRLGNEKLTCLSVKSNEAAISIRLGRQRYLLKWNSFSSSSNCVLVYAVLNLLGRPFSVKKSV